MSQQAAGGADSEREGGDGDDFAARSLSDPLSDGDFEGDDAGDDDSQQRAAAEEDGELVKRKLVIFECEDIRASIGKIWSVLPRGDPSTNGYGPESDELSMNGYVECHLRLQKCLAKGFDVERAIAAAIDDWDEDVPEGQEWMSQQEFSMFLFELCSLWCGPRVSLQLYLLFLSTVFIAVTDARGTHTVGLKPLDQVERLPQAFFDLLTSQGWTKKRRGQDEDEDYNTWCAKNVSPAGQQLAREQAQRQAFEVTHDARALSLVRSQGVTEEFRRALDKVKSASDNMTKVWSRPPQAALPAPAPSAAEARAARAHAAQLQLAVQPRRGGSAPAPRARAAPPAAPAPPQQAVRLEPVPIGRAFETRRADRQARGLALAPGNVLPEATQTAPGALALRAPSPLTGAGSTVVGARAQGASQQGPRALEPWPPPGWRGAAQPLPSAEEVGLLDAKMLLPNYILPRAPAEVYQRQVEPLMKVSASELIHRAIVEYKRVKALQEPFGRVLQKLSDRARPDGPGTAPRASGGPMEKPSEPLWSEMNTRLQKILQKQGRRADRRRRRRQKARQQGLARLPKPTPGRELREYLDRHAASLRDPAAFSHSEFVEKANEARQLHRERDAEIQRRFRTPLVADGFCDGSRTVRAVYVPPPPSGA